MGKFKANDLREKSIAQLGQELVEQKKQLLEFRAQQAAKNLRGYKINEYRKNIASILTVISEKNRDEAIKKYQGKKYKPLDLRYKKTRALRRQLSPKQKALKTLRQQKKEIHFGKRIYAIKA
ncbi:60S ribosomal protein L35, L29 [Mycoemilia scoparia]|uniref:60S ribosomal protein L35, L29 n=1 Tax=Mycoemilia scoparia TaxID=417184 RepID=A0A9W7ZVE7_9FUNG|nr:60S ribosomal protein L35, L29 [Mycoemilia scoparia]